MALSLRLPDLLARVGGEVAVSQWIEVSQQLIDGFAEAVHDAQWIHVDPARAARDSPFRDETGRGRTVAHGFLTLSLLTHLIESAIDFSDRRAGINVGLNKVRFTGPVVAGSRVRARFTLVGFRPITDGAQLTWDVTVECEGAAKPVLVAEWLTRVLTR
jgi:acyl dehydratase